MWVRVVTSTQRQIARIALPFVCAVGVGVFLAVAGHELRWTGTSVVVVGAALVGVLALFGTPLVVVTDELIRDFARVDDKQAGEWLERHLNLIEDALTHAVRVVPVSSDGQPCEHDYQLHPQSDDFGLCSKCGEEKDWNVDEPPARPVVEASGEREGLREVIDRLMDLASETWPSGQAPGGWNGVLNDLSRLRDELVPSGPPESDERALDRAEARARERFAVAYEAEGALLDPESRFESALSAFRAALSEKA